MFTNELPDRPDQAWLKSLQTCRLEEYRRNVKLGWKPVFVIAPTSDILSPKWRLLVRDDRGEVWSVLGSDAKSPRLLGSVRQVYQAARNAKVSVLQVPVDLTG